MIFDLLIRYFRFTW